MDQIKLFSVVGEGLSTGGTTHRWCVHRVPGRGSCEQWWGRGIIYGNLQHIHMYMNIYKNVDTYYGLKCFANFCGCIC